MNKFKQVSSFSHQMSLAVGSGPRGPCTGRSNVWEVWGQGRGSCIVRSNALWVIITLVSSREQTDTAKNITFLQLCWQTAIKIRGDMKLREILDLCWIRRDVSMGGVFFYLFISSCRPTQTQQWKKVVCTSAKSNRMLRGCLH